jgi:hypothetical protein
MKLGAAVQDGLESGFLVIGQGVRVAAEPVRDAADGGRGWRQRLPGRAVPGEVVADDGVAALVAEILDRGRRPAGRRSGPFGGCLSEAVGRGRSEGLVQPASEKHYKSGHK